MSSKNTSILCAKKRDPAANKNLPESSFLLNNQMNFKVIWQTISQLEHYLIKNHRQDYKLRMSLDRQTEKILDLQVCLRNERQRNERLVNLMLEGDSLSSMDEDKREATSKFSNESPESICSLLIQQRYEDLCASYYMCRKQLLERDKELKFTKCQKELLQLKYESLLNDYNQSHKRIEQTYALYLSSQQLKNYKIHHMQKALGDASNCLKIAQKILSRSTIKGDKNLSLKKDFQQNSRTFLRSLQLREWRYCKCSLNCK